VTALTLISKRALIKTALSDDKESIKFLQEELNAYSRSSIKLCTSFRALHDVISDPENIEEHAKAPPILVLEWLDCTLSDLPSKHHLHNYPLFKAIVDVVMRSSITLSKDSLVNTGNVAILED
jgi:hypothetical protein